MRKSRTVVYEDRAVTAGRHKKEVCFFLCVFLEKSPTTHCYFFESSIACLLCWIYSSAESTV